MNIDNTYATLDPRLYHKQRPTPLDDAVAGHFNPLVAKQIGWRGDELMDNWVQILSGNHVPQAFDPLAMVYAGHQFGHWAGQLGDGRGLLLAQIRDEHNQLIDLHLKGAGMTPYSRMGDGRAVLRSTIREYLGGHAMNRLGIASSNALGFVTSGTQVYREGLEQGACLLRVADSHIRLGHFEWVARFAPKLLAEFTEYVITTYYPDLVTSQTPLADFAHAVITRTAVLIAKWQLIGFAHGVMNTDNLSITAATLDFGPFGFMERFNPAWINNHSDHTGRYAYQNQPAVGRWNLQVWLMHMATLTDTTVFSHPFLLPEHLYADTGSEPSLMPLVDAFDAAFTDHYHRGVCQKLGVQWVTDNTDAGPLNEQVLSLAFEYLDILQSNQFDYTNGFRALLAVVVHMLDTPNAAELMEPQRLNLDMAAEYQHAAALLNQLRGELADDAQQQRLNAWSTNYQAFIVSYHDHMASDDMSLSRFISDRVLPTMLNANPVYVLRGQMAQRAIEFAQAGSFEEVDRLFDLLTHPFALNNRATKADTTAPAKDAPPLVISCSS